MVSSSPKNHENERILWSGSRRTADRSTFSAFLRQLLSTCVYQVPIDPVACIQRLLRVLAACSPCEIIFMRLDAIPSPKLLGKAISPLPQLFWAFLLPLKSQICLCFPQYHGHSTKGCLLFPLYSPLLAHCSGTSVMPRYASFSSSLFRSLIIKNSYRFLAAPS